VTFSFYQLQTPLHTLSSRASADSPKPELAAALASRVSTFQQSEFRVQSFKVSEASRPTDSSGRRTCSVTHGQPPVRRPDSHQHKEVRNRIRADRNKTLVYAGSFFAPIWRELELFQLKNPGTVQVLPDVLKKIPAPPGYAGTLKDHVEALTRKIPPNEGMMIWKALSGIFASNAEGTVYFSVGSGVGAKDKVFPSTEISVLSRNLNISSEARQMVEYYQRCVREKRTDMNAGFLLG
jgi:hypothetical protein